MKHLILNSLGSGFKKHKVPRKKKKKIKKGVLEFSKIFKESLKSQIPAKFLKQMFT
jgi:hypothetical protein